MSTFDVARDLLQQALDGSFRRDVVAGLSSSKTLGAGLLRLRDQMRSHVWRTASVKIDLSHVVPALDTRTRQDGFHAMHDWDGIADHVNADSIPVDVLSFIGARRGARPFDPQIAAVLIDYYFLYVLALLTLRAWDAGDADARLSTLDALLRTLQGPDGSGQAFAASADTLLLIATSHYEIEERGYDALLGRVRGLDASRRLRIAVTHANSIGCHLRFGFEVTYGRDLSAQRTDNVTDYPWLKFSLETLLKKYGELPAAGTQNHERDAIVEAIFNGLTPDPAAFAGDELWRQHRSSLLDEFESHRPIDGVYSPLAFFFNFSHNVLKGAVVDTALMGDLWTVTLDDLLTGVPREAENAKAKAALAKTLTHYARANPHTIRGRLMPVIVYDQLLGNRACGAAIRALKA